MKNLFFSAIFAVLLYGFSLPAYGQAADAVPEATTERETQILANLKHLFPQLREYPVVMDGLEPSGFEGLDFGSFTINGQQTQTFLVSSDNTKLYLLAADVLDVSRTTEEIEAELAAARAEAAEEARKLSAELASAIVGLPVRGNPNAPVTIIEFSDFECPYCSRAYHTVEQILEKYPEDVKLVYLHYPLPNHPWAKPAAIAAVCAAQQDSDAFWTLHDSYFENQGQLTPGNVIEKSNAYLAEANIDLDAWAACAGDTSSEAYQGAAAAVEGTLEMGTKLGLTGTPGFFINGRFISGAQPLEVFEEVISDVKTDAE